MLRKPINKSESPAYTKQGIPHDEIKSRFSGRMSPITTNSAQYREAKTKLSEEKILAESIEIIGNKL